MPVRLTGQLKVGIEAGKFGGRIPPGEAGADGLGKVVGNESVTEVGADELVGGVSIGEAEDLEGFGPDGAGDDGAGLGGEFGKRERVGPEGAGGAPEELVAVIGELGLPGAKHDGRVGADAGEVGAGGAVADEAGEGENGAVGGDGDAAAADDVGGEQEDEGGGEAAEGAPRDAAAVEC